MGATPNSIFYLGNWAAEGSRQYYEHYFENYRDLELFQRESGTVRSTIMLHSRDQLFRKVTVSCLLNDITQIMPRFTEGQVQIPTPEQFERYFGSREFKFCIPTRLIEKYDISPVHIGQTSPGFVLPSGEAVDWLLAQISPLIKIGRVFIAPDRILITKSAQPHPNGPQNNMWIAMSVTDEDFGPAWSVHDERASAFTPIVSDVGRLPNETEIASIAMPYLTGLDFKAFSQVLADEADRLLSFRAGVKKLLSAARSEQKNSAEIVSDVIRPEIEKIQRRMDQLSSSRNMRLAGWAVGAITLTLSTAMSTWCRVNGRRRQDGW
jgi:hypothetical protein